MAVIYYKREQVYKGDETKFRSLTGNEVDANFYFLRGYDIESVGVDKEAGELILKRVNGDVLKVSANDLVGDITVRFDQDNGVLYVKTKDGEQAIDGFLSEKTGAKVSTDYTLSGDGTSNDPLSVSDMEKTGVFAAADEYKDLTSASTLTDRLFDNMPDGYRVVTKETVSPYGELYSYSEVLRMIHDLAENSSEWRVPSKADWDKMLNSLERENDDCDADESNPHSVKDTSVWLGNKAGRLLKSSSELWGEGAGNSGEDGFNILPVGYLEDTRDGDANGTFGKYAAFWTTTPESENGETMFVKRFDDIDKSGNTQSKVYQEGWDPRKKISVRLVKDYTSDNFNETEYISALGINVPCVLMKDSHTIWTRVNIAPMAYVSEPYELGEWSGATEKVVFLINEWDELNEKWIKRELTDGQGVILKKGLEDGKDYHLYVVTKHDDELDFEDIADVMQGEIEEEIGQELDEIRDDISALTQEVADEVTARTAADQELSDRIDAISGDAGEMAEKLEELEGKINSETTAREDADNALGQRIDDLNTALGDEISSRVTADEAILGEIAVVSGATDTLRADLTTETEERETADNALSDRIDAEAAERAAEDEAINSALADEASARTEADDELSQAIDTLREDVESADAELNNLLAEVNSALTQEIADRIAGDEEQYAEMDRRVEEERQKRKDEENRAQFVEAQLSQRITNEVNDRTNADNEINQRIDDLENTVEVNRVVAGDGIMIEVDENTTISMKVDDATNTIVFGPDHQLLSKLDIQYINGEIKLIANNNEIGSVDTSEFVKDALIKKVEIVYQDGRPYLKITWKTAGEPDDVTLIPLDDLVDVYSAGNGLDLTDSVFSVKIANDSEPFLTVGAGGVKLAGVENKIDEKVNLEKLAREASVIGNAVTDITPEQANSQTLLRVISGSSKFYASNDASDMRYKSNSLEGTIDNIIASASDEAQARQDADTALGNRIDSEESARTAADSAINDALAAATARINELESQLASATSRIEELEEATSDEAIENKIKGVVANLLTGTASQIAITPVYKVGMPETIENLKELNIKFADDAQFLSEI